MRTYLTDPMALAKYRSDSDVSGFRDVTYENPVRDGHLGIGFPIATTPSC